MKTLMKSGYPHALVLLVALTQTACDIKVASDNKIASDNSVPISLLGGPPTVNNYVPHSLTPTTQSLGYVPQSAIEAEKARVTTTLQSLRGESSEGTTAIESAADVTVARIPETPKPASQPNHPVMKVASTSQERTPASGGDGPSTGGVR